MDAGQIDVDDVAPRVAPASIGAIPALAMTMSSAAELVEPGLQCGRQRRLIANIGLSGHDSRAGVLDEFDRRGQIVGCRHRVGDRGDLVADVDRDDVGAIGRQPDRLSAALTAGRAGDERDLAVERAPLGTQLALGRIARDDGLQHLDVRCAVEMLTDGSEQSSPTAGAVLCVFRASASAHCSTNTNVPSASCSEYRSQPGS